MLVDFNDTTIVKDFVSKQEVLQRIDYVRERLNFRTLYSHYNLRWVSDGDHQFSCHFHGTGDKHPSAHYYPTPPRIWCYACGDGGDVVWWIKKQENLASMVAALDFIAKTFNVGFDSNDLTKRIQLLAIVKDDPKRQLIINKATNKVNDFLYEARRQLPQKVKRWDALERLIFARFQELSDSVSLPYLMAVQLYRDWSQWATVLVQQVAREKT